MSKNASAVKKFQLSLRNKRRNKSYKSAIKTLTKKLTSGLNEKLKIDKNYDYILELSALYKKIDKAVSKGILHKNNGARKKSLLAKTVKSLVFQNM
uniref:ribosomal protein S20 n=1 Tax=Gracilaria usneoides TaxID=172951 RepID=UPI001D0FDCB7|nr:ribosomal protein S20 [Crassiphycus usneoides]UAD88642.1 ribosomal protein S20 [Crassiphycus usneoides]